MDKMSQLTARENPTEREEKKFSQGKWLSTRAVSERGCEFSFLKNFQSLGIFTCMKKILNNLV